MCVCLFLCAHKEYALLGVGGSKRALVHHMLMACGEGIIVIGCNVVWL